MKTFFQKLEEQKPFQFEYMYLYRMRESIRYYWGYGMQNREVLYHHNYQDHINEMIRRWKELPYKPMWLRAHELINFKHQTEPYFIYTPSFSCSCTDKSKNTNHFD